jgi:hypothetical protein
MSAATSLSDSDLLITVKTLVARERTATAHLIAALAEVDARRLYLGQGCSSPSHIARRYCTSLSTKPTDGSKPRALCVGFQRFSLSSLTAWCT